MFEYRTDPLLPGHRSASRSGMDVMGYHYLGGLPWIDALVNASMILGGMVLGSVLVARADDHQGGEGLVHKLMERTHEGRRSPYGQLRQIIEGPGAPWPVIEQTVMAFDPMCRALLECKNAHIKDSADGYVDAVKEIAAAVKRRDAKGVRAGFDSLKQSCGDCHFKGGVGGQFEHEHEREREGGREGRRERDD